MTNNGHIPVEEDWEWNDCPFLDLDLAYSKRRFFGKSLDDVAHYFEEAVLGASEDVSYMPVIPFRYYIFAFANHLMNPLTAESSEVSDGASSFLNLLKNKLKEHPDFILPIMDELMPVAEHVAFNQIQDRVYIYGSFPEQLAEIKDLYVRAKVASTET